MSRMMKSKLGNVFRSVPDQCAYGADYTAHEDNYWDGLQLVSWTVKGETVDCSEARCAELQK